MDRTFAGIAALLAVVACVLLATPVSAAEPSNDELATATAVPSVPFETTVVTEGATVSPTDPLGCFGAITPRGFTVWYAYRAERSERLRIAVPPGTGGDLDIALVDATDGSSEVIACSDDLQLEFEAVARRTYGIMLAVRSTVLAHPGRFSLERVVQQRLALRFDPPAARPGQQVIVRASADVPCGPVGGHLYFSRDRAIIERDDPSFIEPAAAAVHEDPSSGVVERMTLERLPAGRYATYWQCIELADGQSVWRGPDFTVLGAELPPTDREPAAPGGSAPPLPQDLVQALSVAGIGGALLLGLIAPHRRRRPRAG